MKRKNIAGVWKLLGGVGRPPVVVGIADGNVASVAAAVTGWSNANARWTWNGTGFEGWKRTYGENVMVNGSGDEVSGRARKRRDRAAENAVAAGVAAGVAAAIETLLARIVAGKGHVVLLFSRKI